MMITTVRAIVFFRNEQLDFVCNRNIFWGDVIEAKLRRLFSNVFVKKSKRSCLRISCSVDSKVTKGK